MTASKGGSATVAETNGGLVPGQQRVSLPLTEDLVEGLHNFHYETRQRSRVSAANELLRLGLQAAKAARKKSRKVEVERGKITRATKPTIPFEVDLLHEVQEFRYLPEIRVDTETAAIRTLMRVGLEAYRQQKEKDLKRKEV